MILTGDDLGYVAAILLALALLAFVYWLVNAIRGL